MTLARVVGDLQPVGIKRTRLGHHLAFEIHHGNWAPVPMKQDALQHLLGVEGDSCLVGTGKYNVVNISEKMYCIYIYRDIYINIGSRVF